MRTDIPEKLLKIISDIEEEGPQSLMRLTVLKKWFSNSLCLASFAIFIAKRASSRKGKIKGEEAVLFNRARDLLKDAQVYDPQISSEQAKHLCNELSNYQKEYKRHKSSAIRIIKNYNLYLIEEGLRIYLWERENPSSGYRLAVSYCENYNPKHGNVLDSKSLFKIHEIVRFMFSYEGLNDFK